jgi:hypothetical protein
MINHGQVAARWLVLVVLCFLELLFSGMGIKFNIYFAHKKIVVRVKK